MIRHLVVFRFRAAVPGEEHDALLHELSMLPVSYPTMIGFSLGRNRSRRDDRFTHAFAVDFDDWAALDEYLESDHHRALVEDRFAPLIAERAIVSFEYSTPD